MSRIGRHTARRLLARLVLLVATFCFAGAAGAAPSEDVKRKALGLLREGNTLLERGRGPEALEKFQQAYALVPSPKLNYNIGQAEALIPGREARAYQALARFTAEALDAGPALRAAAEKQMGALRGKVALVRVTGAPGATLLIDATDAGKLPQTAPAVLAVGRHELSLQTAAGAGPPKTIDVVGGESLDVALTAAAPPVSSQEVPRLPAPVSVAVPATEAPLVQTSAPASGRDGWTWRKKTAVGLLGLAAASVAFGIVQHVRYFDTADEFRSAGCFVDVPQAPCPKLQSRFDAAKVGWVVGYAAGAALAAGGAGLLFVSPTTSSSGLASKGLTVGMEGRF
ncbi:MAG TPA: hypothetical protein VGF45_14970 [Polyangia bacterium]